MQDDTGMRQRLALRGRLAIFVLCLSAAPLVLAQVRIQEIPDSRINDRTTTLEQQVQTLQQQVQLQGQQIGTFQQQIGMLQQQVQALSQESDMLGVLMQNEKVNTANMLSMLEAQVTQYPGQWSQAINQRIAPLEQVVLISGNTVTVKSSGSLNLESPSGTLQIGNGRLHGQFGMAEFSGVLKSDTLITNSVISSSYTPGAGNIW